jgi:E3 ubiquitin-protein ligase UBR4
MLFNPNSRLSRQTACVFLEGLARVPQRRQEIVTLLTSFLVQLGQADPYGAEFFGLYMSLVRKEHWRYYLVSRGLLPKIG